MRLSRKIMEAAGKVEENSTKNGDEVGTKLTTGEGEVCRNKA
jgi:hypothetical protein